VSFTYKNLETGEEYQRTPYVHLTEGTRQDELLYRFQWNYPVFVSQFNPDNVYVGSNVIHMTSDKAKNWEVISPDLTRRLLDQDPEKAEIPGGPIQNDATGVEVYSSIFALEESPHNEGEIWAGSDDGLIHITRDGGKNWENITPKKIIPFQGTINKIELSSSKPGRAIVAVYNYRNDDPKPYIILTNDYGRSWKLISKDNGIPDDHFVRAVAEDPSKDGLIYAGTEFGAYVSFNDGESWNSLQLNLPHVPITDMEVTQNDLVISTQGRGFWLLDKINLLQEVSFVDKNNDKPHIFKPEEAMRTTLGGWRSGSIGYENDISFYLPDDTDISKVSILIKDEKGHEVIDLMENDEYLHDVDYDSTTIYSGVHTFYWDLSYKAPKLQSDFVSMYYSARGGYGPDALPGNYIIEIDINDEVFTQILEISVDPRWEISYDELAKQFNTANTVKDMIEESQKKLEEMRNISEQIRRLLTLTKEKDYHVEIRDNGEKIIRMLRDIEENLYQDKIETSQDEINYPRKWTNHITHLYNRITTDDQEPNDGMMERLEELKNDYETYIEPYDKVISNELKSFTGLLTKYGVEGIILD
tara:strand:+ start:170 stop:1927 length:1758 start_codon:yes stop_codon:yes gene_type:complete